jgi:hypothetical protein
MHWAWDWYIISLTALCSEVDPYRMVDVWMLIFEDLYGIVVDPVKHSIPKASWLDLYHCKAL